MVNQMGKLHNPGGILIEFYRSYQIAENTDEAYSAVFKRSFPEHKYDIFIIE